MPHVEVPKAAHRFAVAAVGVQDVLEGLSGLLVELHLFIGAGEFEQNLQATGLDGLGLEQGGNPFLGVPLLDLDVGHGDVSLHPVGVPVQGLLKQGMGLLDVSREQPPHPFTVNGRHFP